MEIGLLSHPKVIVIVLQSYPLSNTRKNLHKNDINLRNPTQLTDSRALWIRSLNEPTEVLDLEIAHLNEDRSDLAGQTSMEKIMVAAPEGKNVPFFWRRVFLRPHQIYGGLFEVPRVPGRLKNNSFKRWICVCECHTRETQPRKTCGPGHLCAFAG